MTDDPPKAGFLGYRAYLKWVNEVGIGVFLYLLAGLSALASITMFMLTDGSDVSTLQLLLIVMPIVILLYMSIIHAGTG
jgi:hypothetical protein